MGKSMRPERVQVVHGDQNVNKGYGGSLHKPFMKGVPKYEAREAMLLMSDAPVYIALVVIGSLILPQVVNRARSILKKERSKVLIGAIW